MENPTLKSIQKSLPNFFCYFKDNNILAISEDKMQLPFCFLIMEHSKEILMSLAVDYPNAINATFISLVASKLKKVSLTHPFYISSTDGNTYLDAEAFDRWDLESINMESVEPISEAIN